MLDLSVTIITLNEENKIRGCIESLPKDAEVVVLDSGSTDRTCAIAQELGAKVFSRQFDDYAQQKNACIGHATRGWILSIDADETLSREMADRIVDLCSRKSGNSIAPQAYKLRRQLMFMGRLLQYGKTMDSPLRLFTRNAASFVGNIHEKLTLKDSRLNVATLGGKGSYICHESYEDLTDYFTKFNRYTSLMAEKKLNQNASTTLHRLHPLRPWVEFAKRYFLYLGFLDGYAGYCFAYISSAYMFVKYAKLQEMRTMQGKVQGR